MKKLICILLAILVVLMPFSVTVFAASGKKSVGIICDAGASETVKKAADVLENISVSYPVTKL